MLAGAQRHVLREDREFDAEAFVEAVAAAAEDPQVGFACKRGQTVIPTRHPRTARGCVHWKLASRK